MGQSDEKENLKALREERKVYIERARAGIKESNKIIKAIRDQLAAEPKTVPELAAALKLDPARVLCFVAALKKYGEVVEGPKEKDYFKYAPAG
jgi:hypothetical protein